jgi:DNA polymerase III delta prime subunit
MNTTTNTYVYEFLGKPENVFYSLIHCIEKGKKKKLLWGFHSYVKAYDKIKEGDEVFLYATSPISTYVASGYVESKFIDEQKFWPIDSQYGDTWPKRVWIRVVYICINDDILNLLRKSSQRMTINVDYSQLSKYYSNLKYEIRSIPTSKYSPIAPGVIHKIDGEYANKIREILAKYCIKVSTSLREIFKDLTKIEKSTNTGLRHLQALILLHFLTGKNVIIIGPPGSGKTSLAINICKTLGIKSHIITGNPEWTPFDTIGGRDINGIFRPGIITNTIIKCWENLKNSGVPEFLIIDEINRANVDLAFGRLFTLLDVKYRDGPLIERTEGLGDAFKDVLINDNLYVPYSFRIIATMNSYDKALLFKLGYALLRRFAIVEMRRNFKFEPNPQGWIEKVKEFVKEVKSCDIEKSVNLDIIENEFHLTRSEFDDYVLIDSILQIILKRFNGIKGVLEKLAMNLGLTSSDILSLIYKIICTINEKLSEFNVEITEAPIADTIKFLAVSTLLDEIWASQHLVTLLDEAFSSYIIPQLDILGDKVRAERLGLLPVKGAKRLKEELEELSKMMEELTLNRSYKQLKRLAEGESIL